MLPSGKMTPITVFSCVLTVLSAIHSATAAGDRRPAVTNIISNYFTADPFFRAKHKARLHLPTKRRVSVESNAKQDRMSPPLSAPIRMKLGPPIQILPVLPGRERSTPQTDRLHQTNQRKVKTEKRDSTVVVGSKKDGEVVVPAPLLAGSANNKQFGNNFDDLRDNGDARNRRQSFSQLISTSREVIRHCSYKTNKYLHFLRTKNETRNQNSRISLHRRATAKWRVLSSS